MPIDSFSPEEEAAYKGLLDDLLRLHSAARGGTAARGAHRGQAVMAFHRRAGRSRSSAPSFRRVRHRPLPTRSNPNYTQLAGFGDLDAMVELHGHVRAENPGMGVFFKAAPEVKADDLSGHVVIIGGIGWNDVTRRLIDLSQLPVRQEEDPAVATGEIFLTEAEGGRQKYLPEWSSGTGKLMEDVGLLVRMPNPLNSNRTLTMCNGIHSRGVSGAVRTLTDARLRESNEQYIAQNFPENQFGILMRVQVIEGETLTPDFHTEGTVLYQWPVKA